MGLPLDFGPVLSGVVWLLAAAGVASLVWKFVRERSIRVRRCPLCSGDMNESSEFLCANCKDNPTGTRRLFGASRLRRWRRLILALAIVAGAYGATAGPRMWERGWAGAAPTTFLVLGIRWLEAPGPPAPGRFLAAMAARDRVNPGWSEVLHEELLRQRVLTNQIWRWQRRWFIERCAGGDSAHPVASPAWRESRVWVLNLLHDRGGGTLAAGSPGAESLREEMWPLSGGELRRVRDGLVMASIETRARWPLGSEVRMILRPGSLAGKAARKLVVKPRLPGAVAHELRLPDESSRMFEIVYGPEWGDYSVAAGRAEEAGRRIVFDVQLFEDAQAGTSGGKPRLVYETIVRYPSVVGGTLQEVMTAADPAALHDVLSEWFSPASPAARWEGGQIEIVPFAAAHTPAEWARMSRALAKHGATTLGVRVELRRRGEVMARGTAVWRCDKADGVAGPHPLESRLRLRAVDGGPIEWEGPEGWTLRMSGDAEESLRNFGSDVYWAGEIEAPVEWGVERKTSRPPPLAE